MILAVKDDVKCFFILSTYYMEPNEQDAMRARMDEYVQICKMLAVKYLCKLVELHMMFAEYCSIRHCAFIAWDRIHPNQVGATLMAREFLRCCDFDFNKQ